MTLDIFKYIFKILNFKILVFLYQRFLSYLNIMYIVTLITNSNFKNLNFLILPKIDGTYNIKKTIIFIDSVERSKVLKIYSQIFLLDKLKNKGKDIIKSFLWIIKIIIKIE